MCGDEVADLIAQGQEALWSSGDLRSARAWFEQAWTRADQEGRPPERAVAALGLGGLWVREHREDAAWAKVLARQQQAAAEPGLPPGLTAALRVRVAAELDFAEGAHARVLEALEQARRADDPELLAFALSLAHHCLLGPEHAGLRVRLAEELLRTAARSPRPGDALAGMLWLTIDQFLAGDPHAGRSFTRLREALKQHDHQAFGFVVAAVEVMLTIRDGRLEQAEELARECAVLGERCGDADAAAWYRGQLLTIRWFQGRVRELLPSLKEEVNSAALGPLDDSLLGALAVAAAAAGDDLVAAGAVARLDLEALPTSSVWLVTLYGVAEAASWSWAGGSTGCWNRTPGCPRPPAWPSPASGRSGRHSAGPPWPPATPRPRSATCGRRSRTTWLWGTGRPTAFPCTGWPPRCSGTGARRKRPRGQPC